MKCPNCDEEMFAVSTRLDANVVCCPECGREFKVPAARPDEDAKAPPGGSGGGGLDADLRASLEARSRRFVCASPMAPRCAAGGREDLFNWF